MVKRTETIIFLIMSFVSFFSIFAAEKKDEQHVGFEPIVETNDIGVLTGYERITFFLNIPSSSKDICNKIETVASQELEEVGRVFTKPLSVQALLDSINEGDWFINNPFLVYNITQIQDDQGNNPQLFKVSLTFEVPIIIDINQVYCRSALWRSNIYVKSEAPMSIEKVVSSTLNTLIKKFKKDFVEANQASSSLPIFYIAQ